MVLAALTAAVLLAAPVAAMDAPSGAFEDATQVPTLLQEHPAALLQLPQLAVRHFPMVFVLGSRTEGAVGLAAPAVGALARAGIARVFASTRPTTRLGSFAEMGMAATVGRGRVGLAMGLAERVSEESTTSQQQNSFSIARHSASERLVEAAVGCGLEWAATSVDVAGGLRWWRDSRESTSEPGAVGHGFETDESPRGWVVLRATTFQRRSTRVRCFLSYADDGRRNEWYVRSTTLTATGQADDPAATWRAALAGEHELASIGLLTTWASFERLETSSTLPYSVDDSQRTVAGEFTTGRAGVALGHRFATSTLGLFGVSGSYQRVRQELIDLEPGRRSSRLTQESDQFVERFSWGISHTQGRVTVLGAMDTRLSFDEFFTSLDVQVAL